MSSNLDSPRLPEDLDVDAEVQKVMNAWIQRVDFDIEEHIRTIWYGETPSRLQSIHRGGSQQEEAIVKESLVSRAESSPSIICNPAIRQGMSSDGASQGSRTPTTSSPGANTTQPGVRRKNSIPPLIFEGKAKHWFEPVGMPLEYDASQAVESNGNEGNGSEEKQDQIDGQDGESMQAAFLASTTSVHLRETDSEILLMPGVSSGSSGLSGVTIDQILDTNSSGSDSALPVSQLGMEDGEEILTKGGEEHTQLNPTNGFKHSSTLLLDTKPPQDTSNAAGDSTHGLGNQSPQPSTFWNTDPSNQSSIKIARATSSSKQAPAFFPQYTPPNTWHQIAKATSTPNVVIDKALATIPVVSKDDSVSDAMWKVALDTSITAKDIPRALSRTVSNESQTMEIASVGKVDNSGSHDRKRSKSMIVVNRPSEGDTEPSEELEVDVQVLEAPASDIPTLEALESTLEEFRRISDSSGTFEVSKWEGREVSQRGNSDMTGTKVQMGDVPLLLEPEETKDEPEDIIKESSSWREWAIGAERETPGDACIGPSEDFTSRWFDLLLDDGLGDKTTGQARRRPPKSSPSFSNKAISRDSAFESLHRGGTVMASKNWWKGASPECDDFEYIDKVTAFQPQINKRSARLAEKIYQKTANQGSTPGSARLEFLYKLGTFRPREREIAMWARRQLLEDAELRDECTFAPRTNSSRHDRTKSPVCLHEMLPLQVRANKWLHRRDAKIDMYRKMKAQKEDDECTFWPNTTDSKRTMRAASRKRQAPVTSTKQKYPDQSQRKSEGERSVCDLGDAAGARRCPHVDEHNASALGLKKKKKKKKKRSQQQSPYKAKTLEKLYIPSTIGRTVDRDKWAAAVGSSNCDVALDRENGDFRIMSVGVDRKEAVAREAQRVRRMQARLVSPERRETVAAWVYSSRDEDPLGGAHGLYLGRMS